MPKTDTNTRERLMDATERIIREQGIMAVTTKDIACAAGLAEGTLYRHFQDKVDLLLAVMAERISGNFLQLIRELPA
ncbi:MAG: TetR/AcrR family transcriptional regulator, partial [Ktedonobacterales bacterium]